MTSTASGSGTRRALGGTGLEVFPLCLGTNVMGWTADRAQSFSVLDAYAAAGGNFLDTADVYSAWAPGNQGGESERIIGGWLASRRNREEVVVATKVGTHPARQGLTARNVGRALDESLLRLRTDYVDLYYAHYDDPDTPLEETLAALDDLVRVGKVRHVGASNYSPERLELALDVSAREGFASYVAVQPHYNLVERAGYEDGLLELCERRDLACVPYYGLARGFLTGKYRRGVRNDTRREDLDGSSLLDDPQAVRAVEVLADVARGVDTSQGATALGWLLSRPAVSCAIASARTPRQLRDLIPMAAIELGEADLRRLDRALSQP